MAETNQVQVEVDGRVVEFDHAQSFAEVSESIKNELAPERVLTEVLVDDRYIDLDEEEGLAQTSLQNLGRLVFRSKEVGSLLQESMMLAPQICEALTLEVTDIDEFFEKQDLQQAHERIGEMSALVDWLLQLISGLQSYGQEDFRQMKTGELTVLNSVQNMERLLASLHGKLQVQQFDEFRKILTGPFREELMNWKELFTEASKSWTPRSLSRES